MAVNCNSMKTCESKYHFKFNLELFKIFILNFAYIDSKRR